MKVSTTVTKLRRPNPEAAPASLEGQLNARLIGQTQATRAIVPYVQMFQAGLSMEGRPAGVFLLLGPTGTGKTRTVETLAAALHGSERNLVKVDCGEFQMEHEVAKLIGAPPGYLGHRETPPMLTQAKLSAAASEKCPLSIVLFDEIEKAAASMTRLLLGVLDKASLRLGDNTAVNFDRTLIFLTSNLGAQGIAKELRPGLGFERPTVAAEERRARLETVAVNAMKRKFTPEFVNRIDKVITYQPLDRPALERILGLELDEIQRHIDRRLTSRAFQLEVPLRARRALLDQGTSPEYGARELKRTLQRSILQPLAALVAESRIAPGSTVRVEFDGQEFVLDPPSSQAA